MKLTRFVDLAFTFILAYKFKLKSHSLNQEAGERFSGLILRARSHGHASANR